jgi:head-tail adaptor
MGQGARPQAGQRFRDGVRVFRIIAVADQGDAGRYLTCFAREEVAV